MEKSSGRRGGARGRPDGGGLAVGRLAVGRLAEARVAVLGDVMVDRFIWGRVSRISPEAPVPVVEVDRGRDVEDERLGGAANVAHNVVSLRARARLFGVVGDDGSNESVRRLLAAHGIDGEGVLTVAGRATTVKTRVVAQGQQVVRFDVEDRSPLSEEALEALYNRVLDLSGDYDAVIVSDYAKGVVDPRRLPRLVEALRSRGKFVAVDPKARNLEAYVGAGLVTPNRGEALRAAGLEEDLSVRGGAWNELAARAGIVLTKRLQADAVLVTLGEDGMVLVQASGESLHVPAIAAEVFDVTGAGDTVIAILSMARAVGLDWEQSVMLANVAAGIVVGKVGTAVVAPGELERGVQATRQESRCL